MSKEAAVAYFKVVIPMFLEEQWKPRKEKLVRISGLQVEIPTSDLPDTKQE
jgi:hypothetical protein